MRDYMIDRDLMETSEYNFDVINYKQGDKNHDLQVRITNGGQEVDLANYNVTAIITLPNNTILNVTPAKEKDVVTIRLQAEALLQVGYSKVEISIASGVQKVTTFALKYRVIASGAYNNKGVVNPYVPSGKYAVLVVAGQSNSVGYDESPVNPIFDAKQYDRIKQLGYYDDLKHNLEVIPLTHCAENMQDMRPFYNVNSQEYKGTKGIHMPLAKLILKHIPDDYELLIVPVAFGGTGFISTNMNGYDPAKKKPTGTPTQMQGYTWRVGGAFYQTLVNRVQHALDLNDENYYLGMVWCQGENDGPNPTVHNDEFKKMTDAYFKHFNDAGYGARVRSGRFDASQWYIYQTVPFWTKLNASTHTAKNDGNYQNVAKIFEFYKTWSPSTYVDIPFPDVPAEDDKLTNVTNGDGIRNSQGGSNRTSGQWASHYGNNAFRNVVAPAVYELMLKNDAFGM